MLAFDEKPEVDSAAELVIEEVEFNKWTKEQAEFIRKASHQESELVLAFFKDSSKLEIKESPGAEHVEINIKHLQADRTLDFDVYIYLPQNARFVLYTPKGGQMFANQKEKLISEGFSSVHIHKSSLDEVRKYRSKEFIRESALSFR